MRKSFIAVLSAALLVSSTAGAQIAPGPGVHYQAQPDPQSDPQPVVAAPRHKWGGIDLFCGVPSACAGGMIFRPLNWLKLEVGVGHNLMAPGFFGAITLDPMPWAFGLTLTGDAGHYFSGPVPFMQNPPSLEYSFLEALGGLEFGPRNSWRFYFRGGITYLDATVSNFNASNNSSSTTMDPLHAKGWVAPAA